MSAAEAWEINGKLAEFENVSFFDRFSARLKAYRIQVGSDKFPLLTKSLHFYMTSR
jgi:hypothetical protein